jgi:hypothetical protein
MECATLGIVIPRGWETRAVDDPHWSAAAVMDPAFAGMTVPGWLSRSRIGMRRSFLGSSALVPSAVITGLVPVIPMA